MQDATADHTYNHWCWSYSYHPYTSHRSQTSTLHRCLVLTIFQFNFVQVLIYARKMSEMIKTALHILKTYLALFRQ